jgi:hypothetical protein
MGGYIAEGEHMAFGPSEGVGEGLSLGAVTICYIFFF